MDVSKLLISLFTLFIETQFLVPVPDIATEVKALQKCGRIM
jgi:hypothetical protein